MSFFFQAEDGIRDLVRSRGLGDVYKRQVYTNLSNGGQGIFSSKTTFTRKDIALSNATLDSPVSYTHLTLPTSDLV